MSRAHRKSCPTRVSAHSLLSLALTTTYSLALQIVATYKGFFVGHPQTKTFKSTLDWLWTCSLKPRTPAAYLDEIAATEQGGLKSDVSGIATMITRVLTGSNLPADANNIQILVETEMKRHGNGTVCRAEGRVLLAAWVGPSTANSTGSTTTTRAPKRASREEATRFGLFGCDFFAAWGNRTEDGRLLASRNLDIAPATGISAHKLVAVYRFTDGRAPYATVGFAGYLGALAGMSSTGITVSEANLDNAAVSFDGIAWPLRLRELLGSARNLSHARAMWATQNNTAAFNFLVGSASDARRSESDGADADADAYADADADVRVGVRVGVDGGGSPAAAVALETTALATSAFLGNSSVEAAATFACHNGTVMDGHTCSWPNNDGRPVSIGAPLDDCVFRSNHALSPAVMRTQEPLWNDTVMRYFLLHDRLEERSPLTVGDALDVTSLLGIKGADYGSCAPGNFLTGDPTHVMSIVYDPERNGMYAAWEDGMRLKGEDHDWRPAGCNTYLWLDMGKLW